MRTFVYQVLMEPEQGGGYSVYVPDLDGCYSCGIDFNDAVSMAADAMKCFVGVKLCEGDSIPRPTRRACPEGWESVFVSFEIDEKRNEWKTCMSAADAARRLGVSKGRVTRLLDAGQLEGFREWRNTFVTVESVERRLASNPKPGRPRKRAAEGTAAVGAETTVGDMPAAAAPVAATAPVKAGA